VTGDDVVLVIGGGPIGQAAALAARRVGAATVLVSEPDSARRALVDRLGFATVDPTTQGPAEIVALLGAPATAVVDAVGDSRTLQTAFDCSALGSRVVLVGMGAPRVDLSAYAVSTEERTLVGSFAYDEAAFRRTAEWAAAHAADLAPLIDARVGLAEAPATFRALADRTLPASKVLVYPAGTP
jgi:threonine dehydrogenase-like Zn-dependent dehydrogenase